MENTTNYQLNKPAGTDYITPDPFNENADIIDTELKKAETHRGNSTIHVTAAQKAKWDGYGTVHTLTHAKTGTTHALTGLNGAAGVLSCQFKATGAFTTGDTVKVDGAAYTVKLSDGKTAKTGLFVSGALVSCILDTAGKTVNFKAGGGYAEGDLIPKYALQPQLAASYTGSLTPSHVNANITSNISVNRNGTIYGIYTNDSVYNLIRIRPGRDPEVKSLGIGNKPSVYYNYVCADETDDDIAYLNYGSTIVKLRFSTLTTVWSVSGAIHGTPYNTGNVICWRYSVNKAEFLTLSTHTLATYTWDQYSVGYGRAQCLDKNSGFYIWTGNTSYGGYLLKINPETAALIWQKKISFYAGSYSAASAWDEVVLSQNGKEDADNEYAARYALDGTLISKQALAGKNATLFLKLPTAIAGCGYVRYYGDIGQISTTAWDGSSASWVNSWIGTDDGYREINIFYNNQNPLSAYFRIGTIYDILRWDLPFENYKILGEE